MSPTRDHYLFRRSRRRARSLLQVDRIRLRSTTWLSRRTRMTTRILIFTGGRKKERRNGLSTPLQNRRQSQRRKFIGLTIRAAASVAYQSRGAFCTKTATLG